MSFRVGKIRVSRSADGFSIRGATFATAPALGLPEETLPFFSLSYALGNIYASFSRPIAVFDDVLYPPGRCEDAEKAYRAYLREAEGFGVKVVGGHTGCYDGIELPLIVTSAVGTEPERRDPVRPGDSVLLVGRPFLESEWLEYLAGYRSRSVNWRELTPLPLLMRLSEMKDVKILHDVSEGGIWGALLELQEVTGLGIELEEEFHRIVGSRSPADPSYGVVLAVTEEPRRICSEFDECVEIGRINGGNERLTASFSSSLVELYGAVTSWDVKLNRLGVFLRRLKGVECMSRLIPEVGTNVVYAESPGDPPERIAGVNGRIVRSVEGFRSGRPAYGTSRHMALVLKEAMKSDPSIRAAINITLSDALLRVLRELGYETQEASSVDSYCPVLEELRRRGVMSFAVVEPPGYGLEGNVVLFARSLEDLLELLMKICEGLRRLSAT
ncbi:MAG: thiamine-phosphate synthase family protein [Nitrososphaeria archaeon]